MGELISFSRHRLKGKSKQELYLKALERAQDELLEKKHLLHEDITQLHDVITKIAFYGVNVIKSLPRNLSKDRLEYFQNSINIIRISLSILTIRDWKNTFPIEKTYDGAKWGLKDYCSTIEFLKDYDEDTMVSSKLDDLLWGYFNVDLMKFDVNCTLIANDIAKLDGKEDVFIAMSRKFGFDTYTLKENGEMTRNERKPILDAITNTNSKGMS